MNNKRVLVLSGGGAKIGFQVGVTANLLNNFDAVVGVSCGAIWGAMIAQNKTEKAVEVILHLSNKDIFTGDFSAWNIFKRLLTKKTYILDMSPLRLLLEKYVSKEDFIMPAYFVYIDAVTGDKITACSDDLDTKGIIDAIMASAAIPVAMRGVNDRYYDGGLEEVCPLGEAIALGPDMITIINCFNRNTRNTRKKNTLISIASWAFTDKMPETIANNSIENFLMINKILKASNQESVIISWKEKQKIIKRFDCNIFEPMIDLGDSMDFGKELMISRYNAGKNTLFKTE